MSSGDGGRRGKAGPGRSARVLLALAAVAVGFAAADTYVVVLALPDMMAGSGLAIDELQRAAPIVSGFLLGYVAVLPLIGRIADLRGRLPVLVGSLVVFAIGCLVTAAAYDLVSMVVGRFLQGVGGGRAGPRDARPGRRPVPGAPSRGPARGGRRGAGARVACSVRCTARWCSPSRPGRAIFVLNLAGRALALAVLIHTVARSAPERLPAAADPPDPGRAAGHRFDWPGLALAAAAAVVLARSCSSRRPLADAT